MLPSPAGREASPGIGAAPYVRHCPERTLFYQLAEEYHPAFKAHLAAQGTDLPGYVEGSARATSSAGVLSTVCFRASCPPPLRGQPAAVQIRSRRICLRVRRDTCHAEHRIAFSRPLPIIPARAASAIPFTLQEARLVPQLRCSAHGRECGIAGGRGLSRAAGAAVGAERPVSLALYSSRCSSPFGPAKTVQRFAFVCSPTLLP